ncbi:MAG: sugar transferase [Patescibacteria group bacterium]|jgi:exopolysaccharide biosynthesis polyprenyl glycosylphosphotransferase
MKRADLAFAAIFLPVDYLAILLAATAAYALRFAPWFTAFRPVTFELTFSEFLTLVLPVAVIYIAVFAVSGLYNVRPRGLPSEAVRVVVASFASIAVVLAIAFFSRELFDSRFIVLAAWVLSVIFLLVERVSLRVLQRTLRRFGIGVQNVVIIGKTKGANELVAYFAEHPTLGYFPIYHTAHFNEETADRLKKLKRDNELDVILLANTDAERSEVTAIKTFADIEHTSFLYTADLFPGSTLQPIVYTFGGRPVIEVPKTPLDGWGAIYKRTFDIILSLLLILITLPLQVIIALAVVIENPGPIFFTIKRIGMKGQPFPFMKFRSMIKNAHQLRFDPAFIKKYGNEREGTPLFKLSDDPRVTRVGRFIRTWSLDEIPQFYAVLSGSMSLVGPRPHLPEEVAAYKPGERRVLTIKPGITGLSQISGRATLDFEDEVRLDMYYIENWSPWLDLIILVKTPFAVLFRKGAS